MMPGSINGFIFFSCLIGSIKFSFSDPHSTDTCKLVPCIKDGKNGYEVHGNCIVCQKHYFFNIAKEICGCQLCDSDSPMTNCDDNVHHNCRDLKYKCLDSTTPGTKSHDLTTTEQVSTTEVTDTFNTPTSLQVTEPPPKYVDLECDEIYGEMLNDVEEMFDEKCGELLKVHEKMKFNFQACGNKLGSKIEIHENLLSNISQQKNALEKKVDDLKTKYSICTKNLSDTSEQKNALEKKVSDLKTKYSSCTKSKNDWQIIGKLFIVLFLVSLILNGVFIYLQMRV